MGGLTVKTSEFEVKTIGCGLKRSVISVTVTLARSATLNCVAGIESRNQRGGGAEQLQAGRAVCAALGPRHRFGGVRADVKRAVEVERENPRCSCFAGNGSAIGRRARRLTPDCRDVSTGFWRAGQGSERRQGECGCSPRDQAVEFPSLCLRTQTYKKLSSLCGKARYRMRVSSRNQRPDEPNPPAPRAESDSSASSHSTAS